jgi:hypothetical protein
VGGELEPGTWTELVGGLASATALVVAIAALLGEARHRREEAQAARRRHAEAVAIWDDRREGADRGHEEVLTVHNAGTLPVFELAAYATFHDYRQPGSMLDDPLRMAALRPGESWDVIALALGSRFKSGTVRFRDVAGIRWERDLRGTIRELGSDD